MARNQRVTTNTPSPFLTAGSDVELMRQVAGDLKSTIRRLRRDRLFFLAPSEKKHRDEIETDYPINHHRSPSLECRVRIHYHQSKAYLLLDFVKYPYCAEDPNEVARREPTPQKQLQKLRSLTRRIKELTIHVGLSGVATSKRSPHQRTYRWVEKKRLAEVAQGEPAPDWMWPTIYVDPKQSVDEICLHLLVYLRQERMVDESVNGTIVELIQRCFNIKLAKYAYLILGALLKHFTQPENWLAMRKYIGRLFSTLIKEFGDQGQGRRSAKFIPLSVKTTPDSDDEFAEELYQRLDTGKGDWSDNVEYRITSVYGKVMVGQTPVPLTDTHYTVKEAAIELTNEGYKVSPDRLYDWIKRGKIKPVEINHPFKRDQLFDDKALQMVRDELNLSYQRNALIECVMIRRGINRESAGQYIDRQRRKGKSLKEIASKYVSPQRNR